MSISGGEEVLAVFGATGQTGKYVVEIALNELGWQVKALARTPSKLDDVQHDNLSVIKGDFSNSEAIRQTLEGCTRAICVGGGPHSNFKYPKRFMSKFVQEELWPALKKSQTIKSVLFQAGALSKRHMVPTFSQVVVAPFMGLWPMARDNDAVLCFIHKNPLESTKVICTRPGALRDGKGGNHLKVSSLPNQMPLAFVDLARFNLEAVLRDDLDKKYPYVR